MSDEPEEEEEEEEEKPVRVDAQVSPPAIAVGTAMPPPST